MYISIYKYAYMHTYMHIYVHTYNDLLEFGWHTHENEQLRESYMLAYIHADLSAHVHICMYTYIVCMHSYLYVYVYDLLEFG